MARKDADRIGTEPIGKLLAEFSIPAIVAMIFNTLYNIIDAIFLGHAVGEIGIAVTTLAMPIMVILIGFSMLAGQGGNALAAIVLGEGNKREVERILGNTFVLLTGMAIVIGFGSLLFIDGILAIVGADEETYGPTKTFVIIICVGYLFLSLGGGLNHFLRTMGRPNLALMTTVIGTLSCIVFNYMFVFRMGMGVAGSAYATVLGQAVTMIPVMYFLIWSPSAPFHLRWRGMKPDLKIMGRILGLGTASFLMQAAFMAVSIVLNQMLTRYGARTSIGAAGALASIGMVQRVLMLAMTPLIGMTAGAQPIIGYNFGARQWQRVLDVLKLAIFWATIISVAFFLIAHLTPRPIVHIFGIDQELEDFSVLALRINTLIFPVVGFQVVASSYFQSSGQPLKSSILTLTRQIIFLIPLYVTMPLVADKLGFEPLWGVIFAVPVSDLLATLTTAAFLIVELRKLRGYRAASIDTESHKGPRTGPGRRGSSEPLHIEPVPGFDDESDTDNDTTQPNEDATDTTEATPDISTDATDTADDTAD